MLYIVISRIKNNQILNEGNSFFEIYTLSLKHTNNEKMLKKSNN